MSTYFHRGLVAAAAALWLALPAAPAMAGGYCTDKWSDMASAVQANGLTPAKDLQQLAESKVDGKLIKISLCEAGGTFTYKLVVLQPGGQLVNLAVDARTPFPQ